MLCAMATVAPLTAEAQSADRWEFTAAIYGYFPTISGTTTFPPTGGSSSASVDIDTILKNLNFTFMGSFEARKGEWGGYTDVVYLDVGGSATDAKTLSLGGVIPASTVATVDFNLKGWTWTLAGTWRAVNDPDFKTDVLFGARQLHVQPKLDWSFSGNVGQIPLQDRAGSREVTLNNWDAVIGFKGRASFGEGHRWFAPYYLDMGTGASRFTWQAMAGLGYAFGWCDVLGAWRYIGYDFKSGDPLETMNFNGPGIAVVFRW